MVSYSFIFYDTCSPQQKNQLGGPTDFPLKGSKTTDTQNQMNKQMLYKSRKS